MKKICEFLGNIWVATLISLFFLFAYFLTGFFGFTVEWVATLFISSGFVLFSALHYWRTEWVIENEWILQGNIGPAVACLSTSFAMLLYLNDTISGKGLDVYAASASFIGILILLGGIILQRRHNSTKEWREAEASKQDAWRKNALSSIKPTLVLD